MSIANLAGRSDLLGQNNDGTTTAIDTTGCTLIVVGLAWYSGVTTLATFTDSKSNTWTPLTAQVESVVLTVRQWYCVNPTVGSGHTFTGGGETGTYSLIQIFAFSGTHASAPFDQESGATSPLTTALAPGSITPATDNQVFVTSEASIGGEATTLPTGYTGAAYEYTAGVNVGSGIGYKIQTGGAAAENPFWFWSGSGDSAAVVMSTFKEADAVGGYILVKN